MRGFKVTQTDENKRIDKFLFEKLSVPASVLFKAFRKRSVKVNDKRVKENHLLHAGDQVEVYIPDSYLEEANLPALMNKDIQIAYEDSHLLIVSKPQGMPVHADRNNEADVLDEKVRFLMDKRQSQDLEIGFPALCHRIDRNTGGLVIFAKNAETLAIMEEKFKHHEIKKYYQAFVYGIPEHKEMTLTAFLKKDSQKSHVYIYDKPVEGSDRIITRYRILKALYPYALLEVEIVTGKTHQIRAHLAYIGHPLLGDGKYGINTVNRSLRLKYQALFSYRMIFNFTSPSGHLEYLNQKEILLSDIHWEDGLQNTGL